MSLQKQEKALCEGFLRVGISAGFESFCNTLLARVSEKLSAVLLFP